MYSVPRVLIGSDTTPVPTPLLFNIGKLWDMEGKFTDAVCAQYKGDKEALKSIYDQIVNAVEKLGVLEQ